MYTERKIQTVQKLKLNFLKISEIEVKMVCMLVICWGRSKIWFVECCTVKRQVLFISDEELVVIVLWHFGYWMYVVHTHMHQNPPHTHSKHACIKILHTHTLQTHMHTTSGSHPFPHIHIPQTPSPLCEH